MSNESTPEPVHAFKTAVEQGDAPGLRSLLTSHPELRSVLDEPLFSFDAPAVVKAKNDRAVLEVLLDHGADVNARSHWWAGGFGVLDDCDSDLAEWLISRGARVDVHAAAGLGKTERLRQILDADPSLVHAKGGDGQRPLHFARTKEVVDLLLARGAELEARDVDHGSTAAQHMLGNRPELCRYLVTKGARPDVFMACKLGEPALAEEVLKAEPEALSHRIGHEPFTSPGSKGGHIYIFSLGYTARPLMVAAEAGHEALVDWLLGRAPAAERFLFACWQGDGETARGLVVEDPGLVESLPGRDQALICDAAWENRLEAVKLMLEVGFSPQVQGPDSSTPLDRAAFHGFRELVELLLHHDPPLTVKNDFGGTPLGACVWGSEHGWRTDSDYPGTTEALIQAGAPLPQTACGSAAVVEVFVRHGVPRQES